MCHGRRWRIGARSSCGEIAIHLPVGAASSSKPARRNVMASCTTDKVIASSGSEGAMCHRLRWHIGARCHQEIAVHQTVVKPWANGVESTTLCAVHARTNLSTYRRHRLILEKIKTAAAACHREVAVRSAVNAASASAADRTG